MSRHAWKHAAAFVILAWALIALIVVVAVLWHWIIVAAVVLIGYRLIRGPSRRRKSSIAQIITAGAAAYASFNSRWLSPHFKASVPRASGPPAWNTPDPDETIPF